jgi:hypothetical protein
VDGPPPARLDLSRRRAAPSRPAAASRARQVNGRTQARVVSDTNVSFLRSRLRRARIASAARSDRACGAGARVLRGSLPRLRRGCSRARAGGTARPRTLSELATAEARGSPLRREAAAEAGERQGGREQGGGDRTSRWEGRRGPESDFKMGTPDGDCGNRPSRRSTPAQETCGPSPLLNPRPTLCPRGGMKRAHAARRCRCLPPASAVAAAAAASKPRERPPAPAPQARWPKRNKLVSDTTRTRSQPYPVKVGRMVPYSLLLGVTCRPSSSPPRRRGALPRPWPGPRRPPRTRGGAGGWRPPRCGTRRGGCRRWT